MNKVVGFLALALLVGGGIFVYYGANNSKSSNVNTLAASEFEEKDLGLNIDEFPEITWVGPENADPNAKYVVLIEKPNGKNVNDTKQKILDSTSKSLDLGSLGLPSGDYVVLLRYVPSTGSEKPLVDKRSIAIDNDGLVTFANNWLKNPGFEDWKNSNRPMNWKIEQWNIKDKKVADGEAAGARTGSKAVKLFLEKNFVLNTKKDKYEDGKGTYLYSNPITGLNRNDSYVFSVWLKGGMGVTKALCKFSSTKPNGQQGDLGNTVINLTSDWTQCITSPISTLHGYSDVVVAVTPLEGIGAMLVDDAKVLKTK